jgi:hypothetical protein
VGNRVQIRFESDSGVEHLWAEPLENARYRIDNIPFETYSISRGDIVVASEETGTLQFQALWEKSAERTIWARILDQGGIRSETGVWLLGLLSQLDLHYEVVAAANLVAISVPADSQEQLNGWLADCDKLDCEHPDPNLTSPLPAAPGSPAAALREKG